ncbi:GOLPH3/VPS74 family protein [Kineosporia babensis]|uniref:GPP34 family phosphoprotein n=1 Tax=Kineosporia babensis TaxID=499548 RepID=A0A9X1N8S0_9ACTN|nr:GPP34 family phosphoprotein [Kineosporia babensis]MCD5309359.1 GPP34 family phosphoprotein [Kineosporia babensis]
MSLICEELFLLLTTDTGVREGFGTQRGIGLTAAVVADLAAAGRVTFDGTKHQRVQVTDPAPPGDPVLDTALARLVELDGKPFAQLVRDRKLNPEKAVGERLAEKGVLNLREALLGGLVPAKYPTLDPGPEQDLRARLRQTLDGGPVAEHDVTILSILLALSVHKTVLGRDLPGRSARDLRDQIRALAAESPAGDAVAAAMRSLAAVGAMGAISS